MLSMREFADAIVGVPGTGLNVEQRKLLTIGVELAARPKLLLFLDEPTSGLDSQSSWAICAFLRKLADSGQYVLPPFPHPPHPSQPTVQRLTRNPGPSSAPSTSPPPSSSSSSTASSSLLAAERQFTSATSARTRRRSSTTSSATAPAAAATRRTPPST